MVAIASSYLRRFPQRDSFLVPSGCRKHALLDESRCIWMLLRVLRIAECLRGLNGQSRVLTRLLVKGGGTVQVPSTPQDPSGEIQRGFAYLDLVLTLTVMDCHSNCHSSPVQVAGT